MFPRILVATDLSPASQEVISCLTSLRALGTNEVILVHCINVRGVRYLTDQIKRLVLPFIDDQKQILEGQGFVTTVEIVLGLPHIEIDRLAIERNCSLIVIGSIGESIWGEVLLGGVANAVLHHASKPALVIRLKVREKNGKMTCEVHRRNFLEHILFPTDFSDNAEHAFTYVEKVVESGTKHITLLHVQDKARIAKYLENRLDEFNKIDIDRLERLKEVLLNKGATDVRIELPYGLPTQEILKKIQGSDISLVIMGSQGRGFINEVFLGSVSHNVARYSPVSVLLIPALR